MNTETVLAHILPAVEHIIKVVVSHIAQQSSPPTLYELEEQTQAVLPQIGQVFLQGVVSGQGAGMVGPEHPCACGEQQRYHDQSRERTIQTSVGAIQLNKRAIYHCPVCRANRYPLDEQLGLGQAGRMSRYLQDQCGWLLALLPASPSRPWFALAGLQWPSVKCANMGRRWEQNSSRSSSID